MPHQTTCSDISPLLKLTKYNHVCQKFSTNSFKFWNAAERCGNIVSLSLLHEYTMQQRNMTLIHYFSVRYLRSNGEVFKVVVQELKCGSVLWVCIPTLQHQPIDVIWYMVRHWFRHAVSLLNLVNNFPSMHTCQHWHQKSIFLELLHNNKI